MTAYNPDAPDLESPFSSTEINVFVTQSSCFVDIEPGDFILRLKEEDVTTGEELVTVTAISSCGPDDRGDIQYFITMQMFAPCKYFKS